MARIYKAPKLSNWVSTAKVHFFVNPAGRLSRPAAIAVNLEALCVLFELVRPTRHAVLHFRAARELSSNLQRAQFRANLVQFSKGTICKLFEVL